MTCMHKQAIICKKRKRITQWLRQTKKLDCKINNTMVKRGLCSVTSVDLSFLYIEWDKNKNWMLFKTAVQCCLKP